MGLIGDLEERSARCYIATFSAFLKDSIGFKKVRSVSFGLFTLTALLIGIFVSTVDTRSSSPMSTTSGSQGSASLGYTVYYSVRRLI